VQLAKKGGRKRKRPEAEAGAGPGDLTGLQDLTLEIEAEQGVSAGASLEGMAGRIAEDTGALDALVVHIIARATELRPVPPPADVYIFGIMPHCDSLVYMAVGRGALASEQQQGKEHKGTGREEPFVTPRGPRGAAAAPREPRPNLHLACCVPTPPPSPSDQRTSGPLQGGFLHPTSLAHAPAAHTFRAADAYYYRCFSYLQVMRDTAPAEEGACGWVASNGSSYCTTQDRGARLHFQTGGHLYARTVPEATRWATDRKRDCLFTWGGVISP
jgi:hypothetical protein